MISKKSLFWHVLLIVTNVHYYIAQTAVILRARPIVIVMIRQGDDFWVSCWVRSGCTIAELSRAEALEHCRAENNNTLIMNGIFSRPSTSSPTNRMAITRVYVCTHTHRVEALTAAKEYSMVIKCRRRLYGWLTDRVTQDPLCLLSSLVPSIVTLRRNRVRVVQGVLL